MAKRRGRKRKGGRPRIPNVERTDKGRISRASAAVVVRNRETEKAARSTVVQGRVKHHPGMKEETAVSPLAGYELGRLHLRRELEAWELEAGNRFAADVAEYYFTTGIAFPSARSASLAGTMGGDHEYVPDEADRSFKALQWMRRVQSASKRYMGLQGCIGLFDKPGRPVLTTLMSVCVRDMDTSSWPPHMLNWLHKGLRALAEFYGIDTRDVDTRGKAA